MTSRRKTARALGYRQERKKIYCKVLIVIYNAHYVYLTTITSRKVVVVVVVAT